MTKPDLNERYGQEQFKNLNLPQETNGRDQTGLNRVIRRAYYLPLIKYAAKPAFVLLTALGVGAAINIGTENQTAIADAFNSSLDNASKRFTSGDMASQKSYEQQMRDIKETSKASEYLQSLEVEKTTSFRVEDIRVVNGSHTVAVVTLLDGTKAFAEGDTDPISGTLTLNKKATLNFNAYGAFVSATDTKIAGAFGNAGPGQNEGITVLTKDGWVTQQTLNTGGQFINAEITEDNAFLLARQSNTVVSDNDYVYTAYILSTGSLITITNCAGCVEGSLQAPITKSPTNPNVYVTGANSAFPSLGYTHGEIDIQVTKTMTTTQFHPEEGNSIGRRLPQFTNTQGEREVWLMNNDTLDPTGTRTIGTLFRNFNDVNDQNKDVRPKISLYPEANSGSVLYNIGISAATADVSTDKGFIATEVNINNILYAHVEVFPLSNPGDLTQRMLIPEDGDWPTGGMQGDSVYSINVLNQGAEKYLLVDRRTDAGNCLLIRRITDGFTSANPWKKVELTIPVTTIIGYKTYVPFVLKGN